MRTLTTLLTVAAVLFHAVVGCCVHHAHAEQPCRYHAVDHREGDPGREHGYSQLEHSHGHKSCCHSDDGEAKHPEDCSCEVCQADDRTSHKQHSDHSQSPCDESPCHWGVTSGPVNLLVLQDWIDTSLPDSFALATTVGSGWQQELFRAEAAAPDRLLSQLRLHAPLEVWLL